MGSPLIESLCFHPLFADLNEEKREQIRPSLSWVEKKAGEVLVEEGATDRDLFIMQSGRAEVLRGPEQVVIQTIGPNEMIGEMALVSNAPRSATVRCSQDSTLVRCNAAELKVLLEKEKSASAAFILGLSQALSERVKDSTNKHVIALEAALKESKAREVLSLFMVAVISLLVTYSVATMTLQKLLPGGRTTGLISAPLILLLAVSYGLIAKRSGKPASYFGLHTQNWKKHLSEAGLLTLAMAALLVPFKWYLINYNDAFAGQTVFLAREHFDTRLMVLLIVYMLLSPVQELICRGMLQSSFTELLPGESSYHTAIVLSNVLYAFAHMHIGLPFALVTLIPGLIWGYLYRRQNSLVGVAFSHATLGAFFLIALNLGPWLKSF